MSWIGAVSVAARRGIPWANLLLAGFALWLSNHPYFGLWHDARIYGLIAAHSLHPDALGQDLFFRFGSQGSVSLFTPIYGALVAWLGLNQAAWWVVLSGAVAWVAAIALLAVRILGPGAGTVLAVLLGAALSISYSPNSTTFVLTESFATARSWAYPLGVLGVAALAWRARAWAWSFSGLALMIHPLLGIWPVALCVLQALSPLHVAALTAMFVASMVAAWLAVPEFSFLPLMAGEWLEFVRGTQDVLFKPGESRLPGYGAALAALLAASRWGTEPFRDLYRNGLVLGIAGLGLSLMASFGPPYELLIQVQAWRVCWLLVPLVMIGVLDIGQRVSRADAGGPVVVALLATPFAVGGFTWINAFYLFGIASLIPTRFWEPAGKFLARRRGHFMVTVILVWVILLPGMLAELDIVGSKMLQPWWQGAVWLHGLVAGGGWDLPLLVAMYVAWGPKSSRAAFHLGITCALVALLFLAFQDWDRRTRDRRIAEACYLNDRCASHPFRQAIGAGETVFWAERELDVWFILNRANYFGNVQRIGSVFSREKFLEWRRREAHVAAGTDPARLCGEPKLDWVISSATIPGTRPRHEAGGDRLYACADFRANSARQGKIE